MARLEVKSALTLDGTQFFGVMKQADMAGQRFSTSFKNYIAGAFTVGAVTQVFNSLKNTISTLKDLSEQYEITTDEVQQLTFAAEQDGLKFEHFGKALIKLGQARREAGEGNEELRSVFARYGITLSDIQDPHQRNIDLLKRMSQEMRDGNLSIEDRIKLVDLLGKAAERLANAMKDADSRQGILYSYNDIARADAMIKRGERFMARAMAGYAGMVGSFADNPLNMYGPAQLKFWKTLFGGGESSGGGGKGELIGPPVPPGHPMFEDKAAQDRRKSQREAEAKADEKLAKIEFQRMSTEEKRAKLQKDIAAELGAARRYGPTQDDRLTHVSRAADLFSELQGLPQESRQPHRNELNRIGGAIGPSLELRSPMEAQKVKLEQILREIQNTNQILQNGNGGLE